MDLSKTKRTRKVKGGVSAPRFYRPTDPAEIPEAPVCRGVYPGITAAAETVKRYRRIEVRRRPHSR